MSVVSASSIDAESCRDRTVPFDKGRIRWIAFDAVDTLIRPEPSVAEAYHRVAKRHGSRLECEQIERRFREAFAGLEGDPALRCNCPEVDDPFHTCEMRERLRWRALVTHVIDDVADPESVFADLFAHFGQPSSWRTFPEVGNVLRTLRESGYRLAISSNFDARLHAVMDGLPELEPIELRVISSIVRHRKPSARFFTVLLEATASEPSELLFVGDHPRNDIAAAAAAGIPALQIDRVRPDAHNRLLRTLSELIDLLRD